jgi:hypothetical protein
MVLIAGSAEITGRVGLDLLNDVCQVVMIELDILPDIAISSAGLGGGRSRIGGGGGRLADGKELGSWLYLGHVGRGTKVKGGRLGGWDGRGRCC